jgi:hypothetical protein
MSDETVPQQRSLVKKLCRIMKAVGYLQKTGRNQKQEYNYATEADVAEMLRDKLAEENVFIFPNCVRNERTRIERPGYNAGEFKVSYATDVEMEWTFEDGDSGETRVCKIPGSSETPGDKGVYVAQTGSEKYLLMKAFLIPTGDDPERDENEQRGTKADAQAVAARKLAEHAAKSTPQGTASRPANAAPVAQDGDFNAAVAEADAQRINSEVFGGDAIDYEADGRGLDAVTEYPVVTNVEDKLDKNKNRFIKITWNGKVIYCRQKSVFGWLTELKGKHCNFQIDETEPKYPSLTYILQIGRQTFTENAPDIQQSER